MEYVSEVVNAFSPHANPEYAARMSKYMKDKFAYLGINSPRRKELSKPFLAKDKTPATGDLPKVVHAFWNLEAREFQYFAVDLLIKTNNKAPSNQVDLYESLIVKKSWWDTVDGLAGWLVGAHFERYPGLVANYTNRWMDSDNIWLQRTCLLFQLKYKQRTDFELLKSFIYPLTSSKEFFIRKAIGWALREYSKTNPEAVSQFVSTTSLSPLSSREAMRIILAGRL